MVNYLFPVFYGLVALILLWQAIKAISKGFQAKNELSNENEDRTGRITIHPELLDQEGRITEEELLTVRFSEDTDPPHSTETPAE